MKYFRAKNFMKFYITTCYLHLQQHHQGNEPTTGSYFNAPGA